MDDLDISLVIQQWNQLVHSMENSMEDYPLGLLRFASRSILNAPSSRDGCPVKNAGLTMKNCGLTKKYDDYHVSEMWFQQGKFVDSKDDLTNKKL